MPSKIPPNAAPSYSANDNGPLTTGQVKALKWAIGIMSLMIVGALLAIFARVIYLSSIKKPTAVPASSIATLAPQHKLALPAGSVVKSLSLEGDRLLVHYETSTGHGAAVLDLTTGKSLSKVTISIGESATR